MIYAIGDESHQVILGTLLGDGYFLKLASRQINHKLAFTHSLSQKDYALWKAKKIGLPYFTYERNRYDKRTKKTYKSISIHFKSNPVFSRYYDVFYPKGKKIVTAQTLSSINSLGIATWYFDDGNLYQNADCSHLTLSIQSFTNKESIVNFFKKKLDISFKIHCGAIRLTNKSDIKKFIDYVAMNTPDSMNYKINFIDYKSYNNRYYG